MPPIGVPTIPDGTTSAARSIRSGAMAASSRNGPTPCDAATNAGRSSPSPSSRSRSHGPNASSWIGRTPSLRPGCPSVSGAQILARSAIDASHARVSGLTTLPPWSMTTSGAPSGPATRTCVLPTRVSTVRSEVSNGSAARASS